jgi:Flp pilus assembly protein TadD
VAADAEARRQQADALRREGRFAEAAATYRQAVAARPDFPEAWNGLGIALGRSGQPDEAVASFGQALRLRPDYPQAHNNLGIALAERGDWEGAAASYRESLRLRPDEAEVHLNLAGALLKLDQPDTAEDHCRQALGLQPSHAGARFTLGNVLVRRGRPEEAVACYQEAVRLRPDFAQAHNNLANALRDAGRPDEAVACYRQAVRLQPDSAEILHNLGVALFQQGRLGEALASLDAAVWQQPDYVDAHMNRAAALLLGGQWREGWAEYEWRKQAKSGSMPTFRQPSWDGLPLGGRTILLWTEQGLGDTIQFVRYAGLARQRGGRVLLGCQAPLVRLLSGMAGVEQVIAGGTVPPPFDVQAPLMSLPALLDVGPLPESVPYLAAEPERVERWRARLASVPGLKVGIAWQGNPSYKADRSRSVPLARFAPLAAVPGVSLVSLQRGPGAEQVAALDGAFAVTQLGDDLDDDGAFLDTAAVMKCLDVVVTTDTAIPHLAGALGVQTWVALAHAPDWRWLLHRRDCPWYPSLRLFRQPQPGDWDAVFVTLARALGRRVASGAPQVA